MNHLMMLQAWALATARSATNRLREHERDDAGFSTVEYLVAAVILVPAIIIIITLIVGWLQGKAEDVTSQ